MLFLSVMCATFLMPYLSMFSQNMNTRNLITLIIALIILLVNSLPFLIQSEIIKISSGNIEMHTSTTFLYRIVYSNKYILKASMFSAVTTFLVLLIYLLILGVEQFNEILLYSLCIAISYIACLLTFDRLRKNKEFKKRIYLMLQPFVLFSIPLCCSFYIIDTLNGNLEYISLLVLISGFLVIYYLISYKYAKMSKPVYALTTITIAIALAFVYYGFGFTKSTIIHSNIRLLMVSLFYGIYLSLLYSISYTLIYPIRTLNVRHSIDKFLVCLFNCSPFIALPVLLFCFDSEQIIYCYIILNLIAVNLVGQTKKYNILLSVILIFLFILTVTFSLKFANERIYDYEVDFKFSAEILSILLGIPLELLLKKIVPYFINVDYSVLRNYRAYYITYVVNFCVLILETSFFEVYHVYNGSRMLLSLRPIYIYLMLSTATVILRLLYELFKSNAITKK